VRTVVFWLLLAGMWLVPVAVGAVQLRGLRHGVPPSARWLLAGVAVLYAVVIPVLTLAFAFALLVFDCHGGYECPF
jgi:hypothetical protein